MNTTPFIYDLLYFLTVTISSGVAFSAFIALIALVANALQRLLLARPCISKYKTPSDFRGTVSNHPFDIESLSVVTQNPHAHAARRRSVARNWIHTLIAKLGRKSFAMNLSNSDIRKQIRGNRELRTLKDTNYYNITSNSMPEHGEDIVAIDDLYHTTFPQFNNILRDSHDKDANIFSYTHAPIVPSYTSDEFQIQFHNDRWDFLGPDSAVYSDQLWDTNDEIISHISLGKRDFRCFLYTTIIVSFLSLYVHQLLTESLTIDDFHVFTIKFLWYENKICYEWVRYSFAYLVPSYFPWIPTLVFGSINVSLPFSVVIPWYKFNEIIYHMPQRIVCPVEHQYILWFTIAYAASVFVPVMMFVSFMRLRSGTHFAFRKNCGENRAIWVLHPAASFNFYLTFFHAISIVKHLPRRLKPAVINAPATELSPDGSVYHAMQHVVEGKINYSYSLAGTSASVTLDDRAYTIIRSWNANNKKLLSPSTFTRMYRGNFENARSWTTEELLVGIAAVTYATEHTHVVDYERPPNTWNYTMRPDDFPIDKECVSSFAAYFDGPILGKTYIPINSRGNSEHSIETRVKAIAKTMPPPNNKQYNLIREFMTEYRKDAHPTIPLTHEEVMERQTKPNQRVTNEEAVQTQPRDYLYVASIFGKITKAFQKTEASTKPGDPRNITVMPPTVRLENSRFAYALSSNLKKTKWYAFGLTPKQISQAVADHVSDARTTHIALGDYSRMDGTVNNRVREFDRAFLRHNFHPEHHEEVLLWYDQTYGNKVGAGHGVYYDQLLSQASGDPYTSALNTARNAFVNFCILRRFLTPRGAYANLGLMAGDDSIQRNVTSDDAVRVARSWGFRLKINLAEPGERVDFLSRIYSPSVWYGSTHNIAAPMRLLSKFHTSKLTHQVDRDVIAHTKARSVLSNDSHTYIIGKYMKMIYDQTKNASDLIQPNLKADLSNKLEEEKTWASRTHNSSDDGYQWDMKQVEDWQHDVFADDQFDSSLLDEFESWTELDAPWYEPPVLHQEDIAQRNVCYLANGEIIPAEYNLELNPSSVVTFSDPPPQPVVRQQQTVDDGIDRKYVQPSDFPCKRDKKSSHGWYKGLPPCSGRVDKPNRFCVACHKVYMTSRKAKA
jgi:hypothetical protein